MLESWPCFVLCEIESVAQVAHFKGHLKKVSGCNTMPYEIYYLVRNEEAEGSNPFSSTNLTRCESLN